MRDDVLSIFVGVASRLAEPERGKRDGKHASDDCDDSIDDRVDDRVDNSVDDSVDVYGDNDGNNDGYLLYGDDSVFFHEVRSEGAVFELVYYSFSLSSSWTQ